MRKVIDLERFVEAYNRRIHLQNSAMELGHDEQVIRDHIVVQLGYREMFELLLGDDPAAMEFVMTRIDQEWANDSHDSSN